MTPEAAAIAAVNLLLQLATTEINRLQEENNQLRAAIQEMAPKPTETVISAP